MMKPTRGKLPMRPAVGQTPSKKMKPTNMSGTVDPVEVYCRVRPLDNLGEETCLTILNNASVQIIAPENSQAFRSNTSNTKATQYTFRKIFAEKASQKEIFDTVAYPLVEDLVQGRNGLLFAYGVTGSGKTHTMTGEATDGGIVPRCLDVLFNSMGHLQTSKYLIKPDKMNNFEIQSEADAMLERQQSLTNLRNAKTPRKRGVENESARVMDTSKISKVDEDCQYAVYVSYVEVYNNMVFDLLDETPLDPMKPKQFQTRILREDALRHMYVHGVNEVEVKGTVDALELLNRGAKRRRVAHTALNAESSRSHSVYNVRLVSVPLDGQGGAALHDKQALIISQLSLVDLAGSERTNRTKNSGERLREAGSINNTLMTLRTCMETLRDNQQNGSNKIVPYRDSKITHLFKTYFDGDGRVRMVVCVNPRADDYDETILVMKFAEMTQEVQIVRAPPPPVSTPRYDIGLTPGRRKANRLLAEAGKRLEQQGKDLHTSQFDIAHVFTALQNPPFPALELQSVADDVLIPRIMTYLETRLHERSSRAKELHSKQMAFRSALVESQTELTLLREENYRLKSEVSVHRNRVQGVENNLISIDAEKTMAHRRNVDLERYVAALEEELNEKEALLNQGEVEKERMKGKMKTRIQLERERIAKEMQQRWKDQKLQMQNELALKDDKIRAVKELLECREVPRGSSRAFEEAASVPVTPRKVGPPVPPKRGPAVSNPRHRRSRSVDEHWVDHRPAGTLALNTVLQPSLGSRTRSVTKLTEKDITQSKAAHYILTTQEQDSDGQLETKFYKGDVLPTVGGGAQVVLQDVEILTQRSPTSPRHLRSSSGYKRGSDGKPKNSSLERDEVENRCSVAIEGHPQGRRPKKSCM